MIELTIVGAVLLVIFVIVEFCRKIIEEKKA